MAIDVEWQDENGRQLAVYTGPPLDERLSGQAPEGSACLRFIDPYGDTTFNDAQVAALEEELKSVCETTGEAAAQARSLLEFVAQFRDRLHRYLKFIGD
jgi:hypothetical protein